MKIINKSHRQNSGWMSSNPTLSLFWGWNEMHGGSMDRNSNSETGQCGEADRRSWILSVAQKTFYLSLGLSALLLAGCNAAEQTQAEAVQDKTPQSSTAAVTVSKERLDKQAMPQVVMFKSPNCECCTGWANHLRQEGFTVIENKRDDMDVIKAKYGVTQKLASCHTAIVDGYVIEGHVPAADVARLLKERPDVVGLTAPGMPMKSPGMQKPGQTPKNYDVLAFDANGTSHVFSHY